MNYSDSWNSIEILQWKTIAITYGYQSSDLEQNLYFRRNVNR